MLSYIFRILGVFFLLSGVGVFVYDTWLWHKSAEWSWSTVGEVWYAVSPHSLQLLQTFIQRFIWPPLWEFWFIPFLLLPMTLVLSLMGLGFCLLGYVLKKRSI